MQNIMHKLARLFALPAAAAAALAAHSTPKPHTAELGGGLHVGLSTSGYKFVASADSAIPAAAIRRQENVPSGTKWRSGLAASAVIHNHSASPITFTFPDGA